MVEPLVQEGLAPQVLALALRPSKENRELTSAVAGEAEEPVASADLNRALRLDLRLLLVQLELALYQPYVDLAVVVVAHHPMGVAVALPEVAVPEGLAPEVEQAA